jgi:hypothetical protein
MLVDGFVICECCTQECCRRCCLMHAMAVIKFHFPDWKGPTHHDVSPWWWIVFTNFDAFREGNEMLTNIVEIFLIDEVAGPKFPGPIPVCESFSPTAKVKSARERITNCSQQQLEALLPQTIVEHEHKGGGRRTCFSTDGLSQQILSLPSFVRGRSL